MASTDPQELLAQIEALKRQIGMVDEAIQIEQPPNWSASDLKELAKFEQFPSRITALAGRPPGNPWTFRPYPRMLYQARRHPSSGKWTLQLDQPQRYQYATENEWSFARQAYEQFSSSCQRLVASEAEHKAAAREGWCDSAAAALEAREKEHDAAGQAAAERNWEDKNMSDAAKAESAAVEASTFGHVAEIPEQPIARRRGRPPKSATAPAE